MVVKNKGNERKERKREGGGGISILTEREREDRGGEEREGGVTRGST